MKVSNQILQDQKLNPWNQEIVKSINQSSFGLLTEICQTQNPLIPISDSQTERQIIKMIELIKLGEQIKEMQKQRECFTILSKYKNLIQSDSMENKNKILALFLQIIQKVDQIFDNHPNQMVTLEPKVGNFFSISYQMRYKFVNLLKEILNEEKCQIIDQINIKKYCHNFEHFESQLLQNERSIAQFKNFCQYINLIADLK